MIAGQGIAHSELSMSNRKDLHGVQLWTVLPEHCRNVEPSFDHYDNLPVIEWREINLPPGWTTDLPPTRSFEYGVLVVAGQVSVNGHLVNLRQLHITRQAAKNWSLPVQTGQNSSSLEVSRSKKR